MNGTHDLANGVEAESSGRMKRKERGEIEAPGPRIVSKKMKAKLEAKKAREAAAAGGA